MWIRYLMTRKSWLLLIAVILGLTNALILLDQGFALRSASLIYLNGLVLLIGIVFVVWRYKRETAYAASLEGSLDTLSTHWMG